MRIVKALLSLALVANAAGSSWGKAGTYILRPPWIYRMPTF